MKSSAQSIGADGVSDQPVETPHSKSAFSPGRLAPIVILVAGLIAFFALDLDKYVTLSALKENRQVLADWVRETGWLAFLVYMLVYTAVTAFSIPGGAIMTIGGGFLFGPWLGGALTVVGATIGATILFLAARYALADLLRRRAGGAIKKMEDGFRENALSYMLFLRLIPAFPFFLVNLVPAFLGVRLGTYVVGTLFGIIPGSLVYASLGDGFSAIVEQGGDINLGIIFEPRFLLPIVGLGVLALIPVVYKKLKSRSA
ncbi:MAG: TVP38/TMEM64 family protein [Rhodospirillaceae bacterium]|jgi:uncharacterized membrane protein YdjX (TVP38/TMEM64 family)|nr:TVP38/TMEM64 family protein [Rhodospirillaceae bacterium]MBT5455123.1 TVP38/TMEM64 family protein [Rhodospirillaceae bacterium]